MTSTLTDLTLPDESSTTIGVYSSLLLLILIIALKMFNLWERKCKDNNPQKKQREDIEAVHKWMDKTHARVKADHKMLQTLMNHMNLKIEAASS